MCIKELSIPKRDLSIDIFTYYEWCIMATYGYSELFSFNRTSPRVRLKSGEDVPIVQFLEQYFLFDKYIVCSVEHDPRSLLTPRIVSSEPNRSENSIRLTDGSEYRFGFTSKRNLDSAPATLSGKRSVSGWKIR
jgi:hypothetical protein